MSIFQRAGYLVWTQIILVAIILGLFFASIIAGAYRLSVGDQAFLLTGSTELATIQVAEGSEIKTLLPHVTWQPGGAASSAWSTGSIEPAVLTAGPQVRLQLRRFREGPLDVTLSWPDGARPPTLRDREGKVAADLTQGVVLHVALDRKHATESTIPDTVLLSFIGEELEVGQPVGLMRSGTLQSGKLSIYQEPLMWGGRYLANEVTLSPGDFLSWTLKTASASEVAGVAGFLQIGEDKAMQVNATIEAKDVTIHRFGGHAYPVEATRWSRLVNDPLLSALLALLAGAIAISLPLADALSRSHEWFHAHRQNKQSRSEPPARSSAPTAEAVPPPPPAAAIAATNDALPPGA